MKAKVVNKLVMVIITNCVISIISLRAIFSLHQWFEANRAKLNMVWIPESSFLYGLALSSRSKALCAAIIRCLSPTKVHFEQLQLRKGHCFLWPFNAAATPWFLHREHLRVLRGFSWKNSRFIAILLFSWYFVLCLI